MLGDEKHYFWIRAGVEEKTVVEVAAERLANGEKNLGMDLIYE